jgi:hypothetical protein
MTNRIQGLARRALKLTLNDVGMAVFAIEKTARILYKLRCIAVGTLDIAQSTPHPERAGWRYYIINLNCKNM